MSENIWPGIAKVWRRKDADPISEEASRLAEETAKNTSSHSINPMINDHVLTDSQKDCIDYLGENLFIEGVTGSGKSIVLLKRALELHRSHPRESVAFFTTTHVLVKYAKELCPDNTITIQTVDSYCLKVHSYIQKKSVNFEENKDFDAICSDILRHRDQINDNIKYDHVLVDECQGMSVKKVKFLKIMSRKSFTIAVDKTHNTQNIGKSVFGRKKFRSRSFLNNYRSTDEIMKLANDLLLFDRINSDVHGDYIKAGVPGKKPVLLRLDNGIEERKFIIKFLKNIESRSVKNVAIVCRTNDDVDFYDSSLRYEGIDHLALKDSDTLKKARFVISPQVKIVTADSSKGLEFDSVIITDLVEDSYPILPDICSEDEFDEILSRDRNLLYMAMTRAREELYLITLDGMESRFVNELNPKHYRTIQNYTLL